ncbi:hypothetical protein DD237_008288 [Peronospora effusa]|uniref:Uncharacterized protein n=1 Tax=Peronospora effusa TaxID=542832 RepID=A0A425C1G1_9STRA|nr:hypothetical protein DD237_008288 [Peronospora effusa]
MGAAGDIPVPEVPPSEAPSTPRYGAPRGAPKDSFGDLSESKTGASGSTMGNPIPSEPSHPKESSAALISASTSAL